MSTKRGPVMDPMDMFMEQSPPSKCSTIMHCIWKVFTCVFSHVFLVTLVVSYCILGAYTFERLESKNEIEVKRGITSIRGNLTDKLWLMVHVEPVLVQENWTKVVVKELLDFEKNILTQMKQKGWDGSEDENVVQWTFTGALFYSIIVITTIGYGHIAPKTTMGKVVTIFYAIVGIPLMLLCLSNIGDIMASSFRFLYWRVCCFVCTRKPKRKRRGRGGTMRQSSRYSVRSRPGSFRRSVRNSQKSADSGFGPSESVMSHSYSDTDCRYNDDIADTSFNSRAISCRSPRTSRMSRLSDTTLQLPLESVTPRPPRSPAWRATSLDRRPRNADRYRDYDLERGDDFNTKESIAESIAAEKTPVLCNKYAIDDSERKNRSRRSAPPESRSYSLPRQPKPRLEELNNEKPPPSPTPPNSYHDAEITRRTRRKERSAPSPRIMSPMGFAVNRQPRHVDDFGGDYNFQDEPPPRPVPIWLCVCLVVSYILAGAFLFSRWENWKFLDSAYFCFITLTTIGFGDFVPAQGVKDNLELRIALCSLYLLFGIALLAMSFNLVQEEVIANVKSVARRLGILKEDTEDSDG